MHWLKKLLGNEKTILFEKLRQARAKPTGGLASKRLSVWRVDRLIRIEAVEEAAADAERSGRVDGREAVHDAS